MRPCVSFAHRYPYRSSPIQLEAHKGTGGALSSRSNALSAKSCAQIKPSFCVPENAWPLTSSAQDPRALAYEHCFTKRRSESWRRGVASKTEKCPSALPERQAFHPTQPLAFFCALHTVQALRILAENVRLILVPMLTVRYCTEWFPIERVTLSFWRRRALFTGVISPG